jgi:hypothetical protein
MTPKETLEQVAEKYSKRSTAPVFQEAHKQDFIAGARWQQEQAKEMEEEQMIAFAKKCIHKALESDILMAYNQVEQYYNETFKQQEQ